MLTRREFLEASVGSLVAAQLAACGPRAASARPNILFVLSDAHRACSLGCYGNAQVRTPAFDAFAGQGTRLATAISNTPECRPYRASLMSGRHGHHTGVMSNLLPAFADRSGRTSSVNFGLTKDGQWTPGDIGLLGACFRDAGYRCGYVGKWHLGKVEFPGELRLGFDDHWAVWADNQHDYFHGNYVTEDGRTVPSDGRFRPAIETDYAIDFIRRDDARPFLLVLSWGPPHFPGTPPDGFLRDEALQLRPNTSADRAERVATWSLPRYYGLIEAIDAEFGRLLGELDALGLSRRTVAVYTSDHGSMMGSQGLMGKGQPYSESSQVPWLVRWPDHVPAGRVMATPFGTTDILPTLAGLAGIPQPAGHDGADLSGAMLGREDGARQQAVYMAAHEPQEIPRPGWRGVRTERYLYARTEDAPWLLFDVQEDPFEMENLVAAGPRAMKDLDALTLDLMHRFGDSWTL